MKRRGFFGLVAGFVAAALGAPSAAIAKMRRWAPGKFYVVADTSECIRVGADGVSRFVAADGSETKLQPDSDGWITFAIVRRE